ncbi:hypothetical protein [Actinomadura sp. 3N508]|uniref:hypothetical protein n=1 Tax=Actinomadura sp. 3N508 TaxID=3375153 RepID=UPI00379F46AD
MPQDPADAAPAGPPRHGRLPAAPDRRPYQLQPSADGEIVHVATSATGRCYRYRWRQIGWHGQSGALYALGDDAKPGDHEPGSFAPLYLLVDRDEIEDPAPDETGELERFRLEGDENCGVALHCRDCDRGGRPLAYLTGVGGGYDHPEVEETDTIMGLLTYADVHAWHAHGCPPWFNPYSRARFDLARRGAWTVQRIPHEPRPVGPRIQDGMIRRDAGDSTPAHARRYAAQLLAAADEAENRAYPGALPVPVIERDEARPGEVLVVSPPVAPCDPGPNRAVIARKVGGEPRE